MNPLEQSRLDFFEFLKVHVLLIITSILFCCLSSTALAANFSYDTAIVETQSDTGQLRDTLTVKIADSPGKRYRGLRGVKSLKPDRGMLFVYNHSSLRTFTMTGMTIPLDILFINANKQIESVHSVQPGEDMIRSKKPAKWVLEANLDWAKNHGIRPGDRLVIRRSPDADR